MPKRTQITVLVIAIAAISGITLGYFRVAGTIVHAESTTGDALPNPPSWSDIQVVSLISSADAIDKTNLLPASLSQTIGIKAMTSAGDAVKQSQSKGIDILIIGKSSLMSLDPAWAIAQYRRGTAFVGVNITPKELGTLVDDASFANQDSDKTYPEPFVSVTWIETSGAPDRVKAAWESGLISPDHLGDLVSGGFSDVTFKYLRGYGPPVARDGTISANLEDLRLNLDKDNLVKGYQSQ